LVVIVAQTMGPVAPQVNPNTLEEVSRQDAKALDLRSFPPLREKSSSAVKSYRSSIDSRKSRMALLFWRRSG
jgi:hypothetical protein